MDRKEGLMDYPTDLTDQQYNLIADLFNTLRNNNAETSQNLEAGDHKGLPYIELSKEYRMGGTSVYARLRCRDNHTTTI